MGVRRRAAALALAACALAASARAGPEPAANGAGVVVARDAGRSELTDEALAALLAPLADADESTRRRAAAQVQVLGPDATVAIGSELGRLRRGPAGADPGIRDALRAAHASDPKADLLEVLLRAPPKSDLDRRAARQLVLVRALGHIGTTAAVEQLTLVSSDDGGALRDELGARVRDLGERAIPGLIRARRGTTAAISRWAAGQLEGMNRRVAGDCVQTKDPLVLAEVLSAFGAVRDPDALGVVVSFVNADRDVVREAARRATLSYGNDAMPRLREAYLGIVGRPALPEWSLEDLAHALFKADDDVRLQDVRKLVDDGQKKAQASDLAGAASDFDKALARQADLDDRSDLAPVYVTYALSIEDADRARALSYLRKALWLAPEGPRAPQAEAEIAFLEAEDLRGRGVVDADLYRRAVTLDPTHARARAALEGLEAAQSAHRARLRKVGAVGGGLAFMVACAVLFVGRRRRPAKNPR